ncbi:hypothetical protein LJC60_03550 [Ruminococcaceae bacterium OttesenSCG-928-D13]|nr:hypothetical protein [Ruminococcaceae bacterium OttesenSCG-928-D13]
MEALEDSNIDPAVPRVMEGQMKAAIEAGFGCCDFEAAITQLLKEKN